MRTVSTDITARIKELALQAGFTDCGIAPAEALVSDAMHLKQWLQNGMHAGMKYMENHFEKRTDPSKLVPESKSVIVVTLNYFPQQQQSQAEGNFLIAKYAYGRDYHPVMKAMLKKLLYEINSTLAPMNGRAFVDSAPVLERALAAMAGLGWIGKNANLISPRHGSFLFIGELIVDIELNHDKPLPDYCGGCTKCIDACPTNAIVAPRIIESRKCISYWTIEHKGQIDSAMKGRFKNRIFGCDICQDVCPWNRKASESAIGEFQASPSLIKMARKDWQELTEEKFNQLFSNSAVKRAGFGGLLRNIFFSGVQTIEDTPA
jgi:epoxyqueuosine reductase